MEEKIIREVAEQEFNRFLDEMGIDADVRNPADRESFDAQKNILVKAICSGALVINEKGEPIYTPTRSNDKTPLTFYEPTGKTIQAAERRNERLLISRTYDTLAALTRTRGSERFENMSYRDLKICEAILSIFLGG